MARSDIPPQIRSNVLLVLTLLYRYGLKHDPFWSSQSDTHSGSSNPGYSESLHQVPQQRRKSDVPKRQLTKINMLLAQALQHLLKIRLITLRDAPKNSNTYYKPNARCAYHSNSPGHDTNNCWTLKNKIQDLVNDGEIKSIPPETPVVITAPMPSHDMIDWRLDG